jgi:hypothetical protein
VVHQTPEYIAKFVIPYTDYHVANNETETIRTGAARYIRYKKDGSSAQES